MGAIWPVGHGVHEDDPAGEKNPVGQGWQVVAEVLPTAVLEVPAAQLRQEEVPKLG